MKIESAERPQTEFDMAVAAEIARLKAEGYSKAYICERCQATRGIDPFADIRN